MAKKAKGKYDATLNLPETTFPMRANLPVREPETLQFWNDIDIYHKVQEKNAGKPTFILHDGPPYANGNIHMGHCLNKVLKDIIVKYHSMNGYDAPYVPGWDTHGLPIEQQAIKALGIDRHKTDVVRFRDCCKDFALKYVAQQKEQFRRLGVRGDWDDPYLTLKPKFEEEQIKVFGEMARKGYIYKGKKPVYWCASCETALAEAEIEYGDQVSPSIYVKFQVKDGKGKLPQDAFVVIWTTTPWTLPANVAICIHPDFEYVLVQVAGEKYVVAKGMLETLQTELDWHDVEILETYVGKDLEYVTCAHPFMERESLVILGEHVTLEAGTGCVHTAPGHGEDDFNVGKLYKLPVLSPVDNQGRYTEEAGKFAGMSVQEANKPVIAELESRGMLVKLKHYHHQYPFCWRCKNPIIYRATDQWFASIDGFREEALKAIDDVKFIPSWGRDRIYNMIHDRGDWCISRQRTWGVPIPIFYCEDCGHTIIEEETIQHISELFGEYGSNIWFEKEAADLMPEGYSCPNCHGHHFRKETDIMDVWFDSGSSHMSVLSKERGMSWPADLYLEGSDQHRGWFNSSLCTGVAVNGQAPYRSVLTHGFLVDENGHKMSKSRGNGIDPLDLVAEMGADILRLWVSSADYRNDVAVSENIIRQTSDAYRKLRNTCRFALSTISDFDAAADTVPYEQLSELDRWALSRLHHLVQKVTQAYENYEFHVVFHAIHNFCTVDLSSIYFDISKDALYCLQKKDVRRRSIQTVLAEVIRTLDILLTPILAYTSEEIWGYLRKEDEPVSVQLLDWPQADEKKMDDALEQRIDKLMQARELVMKAMEEARTRKTIGHTLGAWARVFADEEWMAFLRSFASLEEICIAAKVELLPASEKTAEAVELPETEGLAVEVRAAEGGKCERCWTITETVGQDAKHPGLCHRCAEVIAAMEEA